VGNAVRPRTLGIDELDCASPDARLGASIGKRGRHPFSEGLGLIRGKNRAFPAFSNGFPEFQATRLRQEGRRKNALYRKGHTVAVMVSRATYVGNLVLRESEGTGTRKI
jgi:hypothetical protein